MENEKKILDEFFLLISSKLCVESGVETNPNLMKDKCDRIPVELKVKVVLTFLADESNKCVSDPDFAVFLSSLFSEMVLEMKSIDEITETFLQKLRYV